MSFINELIDPSSTGLLGFESFRENIPMVLNLSLREPPSNGTQALFFKSYSLCVAVINTIFVVLLASEQETKWLDEHRYQVASLLLLSCVVELLLRTRMSYNILGVRVAKINRAFDGISLTAAIVTFYGKVT